MLQKPQVLRNRISHGHTLSLILCCLSLFLFSAQNLIAQSSAKLVIVNPYAEVDWAHVGRYKASLHTHTRASDGKMYPHEVIDHYHALGYDVLAITDHNKVSYPWTELSTIYGASYENRDPDQVGLLDIPGNEFSKHHHMGSYWTLLEGTTNEVESLEATLARGGQTLLNHPGRYKQTTEWYVDLFKRFPHLKGMEIFNQGDRYPGDRKKWDAVLSETMPERPVWAFSNDDMHTLEQLGRNWNILLLPELTDAQVRRGLDDGLFFYVYAPQGHAGPPVPVIHSITMDEKEAWIQVSVSGHKRLEWISDGVVVHDGARLNLQDTKDIGNYVRLTVYGAEGDTIVGTQPFGIQRSPE